MQKLKISPIILLLSLSFTSNAQVSSVQEQLPKSKTSIPSKNDLINGAISSQFDFIMSTSNNYQDYKVVKKIYLEKLKSNVADSLQEIQSKLTHVNTTLTTHDTAVTSLQDSLTNIKKELKMAKERNESFRFLGFYLSKGSYNTLVWCVISLLLVVLVFYIYRFRQNHKLTADAQKTLEEVRAEFEQHRKRAIEREQKLNRQLQDELNKRL
ncbi:hypothetical protein GCM10023231_32480 [Olivibacter ginsenosidimutans]|uniref:tRNA (Guanine-N1)-methyltransferase n=1 Tax=Olivibacter ginsenosidimutans TaxID=1176537 RepID=A0ABP9BVZ6_9SPHI